MARWPRVVIPDQPLHVVQRGTNRAGIFFIGEDYERFRKTLLQTSERYGCAIHAYVLMTNHFHLLVTPHDRRAPAHFMQSVGRQYVRYVNARYARTGTLFEGRYRSTLIDSEQYLLACSRYIELNPVRAGLVSDPAHYRWSSYRHNALGEDDAGVTPHALYSALGTRPADRQASYRALFVEKLSANAIGAIRTFTKGGSVPGPARFQGHVETVLKRRVTRMPHGGDRRSTAFRSTQEQGEIEAARLFQAPF